MSRKAFISLLFCLSAGLAQNTQAASADRVIFSAEPKVASRIIHREAGETVMLIASNTAFKIQSKNMIGDLAISVQDKGNFRGINFGRASQFSGETTTTTFVSTFTETEVYQTLQKTAYEKGTIIDQSILVTFAYDDIATPEFHIEPS